MACLMLVGCTGGERPALAYTSYAAEGLASWYGEEAAGHLTASGERFAPAGFTAAHRTLPLGSIVEITDLTTGRAILVRINDRGPWRSDRMIDLSQGAAHRLGTDRHPVSPVRIRAVAGGDLREGRILAEGRLPHSDNDGAVHAGRYVVQVASFSDEARARALAGRLGASVVRNGSLWRVRLGPYSTAEAERARDAVARRGYADAHLFATD